MLEHPKLRVFLCYDSNDKLAVRELYQRLLAEDWVDPWLDEANVFPGQDRVLEIEEAVESADAVIVCLSHHSVTNEGNFHKVLKSAIAKAMEKPKGTIFIIPLRLEECTPPKELRDWQSQDYFPEIHQSGMHQRLLKSLHLRAVQLGIIQPFPPIENRLVLDDLSFIKVVEGSFLMGSPEKIRTGIMDKEEPTPRSEIPQMMFAVPYNFWIGKFPVTNLQFAKYAKSTGLSFKIPKGKEAHPIVFISWYETIEFIRWMNGTYKKQLPRGYTISLPSEVEWEKAARGRDGRLYPWGNSFNITHPFDSTLDKLGKDMCNIDESGKSDTTPVDLYTPFGDSPYGVSDMIGNVWEWTRSLWSNNNDIREVSEPDYKYPYNQNDGREDESINGLRVLRGGSHLHSRWQARCASRGFDIAESQYRHAGFRLAIVPLDKKN